MNLNRRAHIAKVQNKRWPHYQKYVNGELRQFYFPTTFRQDWLAMTDDQRREFVDRVVAPVRQEAIARILGEQIDENAVIPLRDAG
jgi:hypothetical protein